MNNEIRMLFEEWKDEIKLTGRGAVDAETYHLLERAFSAGYGCNKVMPASALKKGDLFRKATGRQVYLNLGTYTTQHGYIEGVASSGNKTTVPPDKHVVLIEDKARFFKDYREQEK
jgi:hypothetical protein